MTKRTRYAIVPDIKTLSEIQSSEIRKAVIVYDSDNDVLKYSDGTIYSQLNGFRKRGANNTLYYLDESKNKSKNDSRAKIVINKISGDKYKTVKEAASSLGVRVGTLSQHLTNFRFKDELKNIQYYE